MCVFALRFLMLDKFEKISFTLYLSQQKASKIDSFGDTTDTQENVFDEGQFARKKSKYEKTIT